MTMAVAAASRRDRNMRDKRDRIFRAAAELFAERGFAAVTTQEVSDRADVAAGTLFRYAATKSELLLMIYNEEFRAAIDEGERRAAPIAEPAAAINALVVPTIERSVRTPENSMAYQRELLFGLAAEPYRAEGVELVYRLEGLISARLQAHARERGLSVDSASVRLAGETVFGIINLTIARLSDAPVELSDIERNLRVQIKQVVDGLLTERNDMSNIKNVTVLGTGVLGSQIAYQTAFSGFKVTAYDISDEILAKAKERFEGLASTYQADGVAGAAEGKADAALTHITYSSELAAAVADADLVIEAIPEVLALKQQTYEQLGKVAPAKTIFATNSSTLLPSDLKDFTGRPARFLALHFANQVWKFNTAEVMGTADTDPAVFDEVVAFAGEIGMVAIPIHKEKAGYVLNSLLVPFLNAGYALAAGGYADPKDIDNVWRIATGAPMGPFQITDIIGLTTPYNILSQSGEGKQLGQWLKENYIDKGKLGVATGEGFYTYDAK